MTDKKARKNKIDKNVLEYSLPGYCQTRLRSAADDGFRNRGNTTQNIHDSGNGTCCR